MGAVGEDPAPGDSAEPNNRTATTPAAKSYRCERLQGRQQEQQQRRGPQGPMPRRGSNCNCCRSQWARTLAQRAWVSMKAAAMMLLLLSTHAAGSSLQGLAQHPAGGAVQSGLAQHPGVDPRSLKQCLNSPYAGRPAGWGDLGQAEPTVQALGTWGVPLIPWGRTPRPFQLSRRHAPSHVACLWRVVASLDLSVAHLRCHGAQCDSFNHESGPLPNPQACGGRLASHPPPTAQPRHSPSPLSCRLAACPS